MNTQNTLELMQRLKLSGMARCYEAVLSQPLHEQPEAHLLMAMTVDAEKESRMHRRTQLLLTGSKLRYHSLPEQINCSMDRGLTKEQLLMLCDGLFIDKAENILICGATGCGKSFLACSLGRPACLLGKRTLYYGMSRFIEALAAARLDGSILKWMNQIAKAQLLIIDDFGLKKMDSNARLALLDILEDRYGKGATIITSQLPVSKWHEYIGDATLADAIMDRITAHAHKIDLLGQSLRRKK